MSEQEFIEMIGPCGRFMVPANEVAMHKAKGATIAPAPGAPKKAGAWHRKPGGGGSGKSDESDGSKAGGAKEA